MKGLFPKQLKLTKNIVVKKAYVFVLLEVKSKIFFSLKWPRLVADTSKLFPPH